MWVKALDMILDKLRVVGVDFSKVAALSGTAQVRKYPYYNTCRWHTLLEVTIHTLSHSKCTIEIVYNEHQDQAEFARYNRFSL